MLLSSSLICPDLFPHTAIDDTSELLKQSMDSNVIRTWDGKVPAFQAPPPQPLLCPPGLPTTSLHFSSLESCPTASGDSKPSQTWRTHSLQPRPLQPWPSRSIVPCCPRQWQHAASQRGRGHIYPIYRRHTLTFPSVPIFTAT